MRISRPADSLTNAGGSPAPKSDAARPELRVSLPASPQEGNAIEEGGLTQIELKRLAAHDIVLLIDKSGSMATPDCPLTKAGKLQTLSSLVMGGWGGATSRWNWCLDQTSRMAKETEKALPNGFSVLLFDTRFAVYPNVNVDQLAKIFRQNRPDGGTDLTQPLESTFNDYFRRKNIANGNIKPLLVGVITDGCPNDPDSTVQAIVSATHMLRDTSEMTLIFFLIGSHDSRGEQFVWNLSNNLGSRGARFNIVKAVPFSELEKVGLAHALAENLL